jgi:hypothetical protein
MYNEYIRVIKERRMSKKAAVYYLANVYVHAHNERRLAEEDIDFNDELTEEDIAALEDDIRYYTDAIINAIKVAKHLGIYSDAVFEYGDFSDIHWREDDLVPIF